MLGDNVFIAPNTSILNDKYPKSAFLTPSIIKDNSVIGGGVTILPNVIVGENAVVGGGSVVAKDVLDNMVVTGSPAKVVMTKKQFEVKREAFIQTRNKVNK
jgi:UDP-2-acetamido-3-amino-2,3-dideoxy-glucuronate N-acetyltransferase